jgi:hypothetical protein
MNDLRKAAEKLLEALENPKVDLRGMAQVMTEVRQALAQPEHEPVAWMSDHDVDFKKSSFGTYPCVPLYTAPPKREWVGLTEDEFEKILERHNEATPFAVYLSIEAKLKEKNT